jgi:hypothetical protein
MSEDTKQQSKQMTRKEFLGSLVKGVAGTAGLAALVTACGGGASAGADSPSASCTMNGTTDTIASNHGHVLTVAKADVVAGVDKTYDIMGSASHTHSFTVTAAMFTLLQGNHTAMATTTTTLAHTHDITIMCV